MSKYVNDVRSLSANAAYQGVEFGGVDTIDEAIAQAKVERDHGLAPQYVPPGISRNRAALLQHLNLLGADPQAPHVPGIWSVAYAESRGWLNGPAKLAMELDPSN